MDSQNVNLNTVGIRLAQCAKTFPDGTRALDPVQLEIEPGETLVLLGPSGCGKTTMLRIIAGLEQPDEGGQVFFGTQDVTALPIEQRHVGMVFQSYALFPNMSVAENIAYGLKVRGMPEGEKKQRVAEMLTMMHLDNFAERRIDQLSGGQRQRVALARALAVRPRVLLLDEPLTALDAKLRESLRSEIDRLLRSLKITAVYVTHDQSEAMALGDRIAVMEKGRIAQIGAPREIYYRPATRFVADFIGSMNRVQGVVEGDGLRLPSGLLKVGPRIAPEILFRPEDVRLVDAGEAHLHAKIISAFFLGDHTRLILDIGGEQSITAETVERREFKPGDIVPIAVDAESLLFLE
ncbi:MAG: ABC transporter ATP-binding protein [Betaproteobacteria bacterium]